jgi:hypothetical protein
MAKEIELTQGYKALVDDEDFEYLNRFNWCISHGYAVRKQKNGKGLVLMHRVILGRKLGRELLKSEKVDHVNGNGLDNTRNNLRAATHKQNIRNSAKAAGGTSRFKGVSWHKKSNKWQALIGVNGKVIHLGHFDDEIEAAKKYDMAALLWFGRFARTNFPIPDEILSVLILS